jgi:hypothetical protein
MIIHMARTGARATSCGRTTDRAPTLDPYALAPRPSDRWCIPCWDMRTPAFHECTDVDCSVPEGYLVVMGPRP